jgi:anti-sigma28 factor (negative regulator of flagellin synthesis)
MVIDKIGNINNIAEPKKTRSTSGPRETGRNDSDSILISTEGKKAAEISRHIQMVNEAPDIRAERVRAIKEQVQNGTYNFNDNKVLEMVADKIASFLLSHNNFFDTNLEKRKRRYLYYVRFFYGWTVLNRTIIPDFNLPTEIYIRQDITRSLSEIIARPGTRAILISTSGDFETYYEKALQINETMKRGGSGCIIYDALPGEPPTEDIDLAVAFAKKTNCNMIIGFGGLESLNASKAVALLINNFIFCDDLFSGAEARNEPLKLGHHTGIPGFRTGDSSALLH